MKRLTLLLPLLVIPSTAFAGCSYPGFSDFLGNAVLFFGVCVLVVPLLVLAMGCAAGRNRGLAVTLCVVGAPILAGTLAAIAFHPLLGLVAAILSLLPCVCVGGLVDTVAHHSRSARC